MFQNTKLETLKDNLESLYYRLLPYDYRPKQLWYKLLCWAYYRYSTVRPRNLDNSWCDRDFLMASAMMEILSQYFEKEADQINWQSDEHHRKAYDKIESLYHWWNSVYLRQSVITEEIRRGLDYCFPKTDSPKGYWGKNLQREITEAEYPIYRQWKDLVDRPFFLLSNELDRILEDKLKEVLEVRGYLWS